MRLKILTVLGARPQFIKSKPLSDILRHHRGIREVIVHTGQHYDFCMYNVFLKELNLPKPKYFLGINRGNNVSQVERMLRRLASVIDQEKPDLILVYGDTNSTLAAALAAKQNRIALAHIEAGMRSYNLNMPEELNRVITDKIADLLFVSVQEGVDNLEKEGRDRNVFFVGDVLCDVLLMYKNKIKEIFDQLKGKVGVEERKYCFLTLHRQDSVDNGNNLELLLRNISHIKTKVIFAIHPRTKKMVMRFGLGKYLKGNIHCIPPLSYLQAISLIKYSRFVLTDSGGAQREAYILKTPCATLRNETEWRQTLGNGWNRLIQIDSLHLSKIPQIIDNGVNPGAYSNIFGNGKAAVKIIHVLGKFMLK